LPVYRRRPFFIAAICFAAVGIAVLVFVNVHRALGPDWEGSGHEFMVEHRVVDAAMTFQRNVRRGDALTVILTLKPNPTVTNTSVLADEASGTLDPVLTMTDCTVMPLTRPSAKATSDPVASFVWFWTVTDCTNAGNKELHLLLAYNGSGIDVDPTAYQTSAKVNVTDSLTLDDGLKIAGAISTLLGAVAGVLALFLKRKAGVA
jgi:hypothetical protein